MVGRGHHLLGGPLGRAYQMFVAVARLMVMVMVVMVPGHVAGRRSVVQLRVQLQGRGYHGRVTATVVTAARLVVTAAAVRLTDGHHVVRGIAGPGGRVGRGRVGGSRARRRGRVQVRRRGSHHLVVTGGLLLVTAVRRETGPVVLLVAVRRGQQLLFQIATVPDRSAGIRKRRHRYKFTCD